MIRFGTDGIRGPAGQAPIDVSGGLAVGRAAAQFAEQGRVLVARDRRPSGLALEAAVVAGIVDAHGTAIRAGVLPTAGASEAVAQGLADLAIVLTASHNAAPDNGFKLLVSGGRKPSDAEVAAFEALLAEGGPHGGVGRVEDCVVEAMRTYIGALDARVPQGMVADQRLVVDLANGASVVLRDWLQSLGPGVSFLAAGEGVENEDCGAVYPGRLGQAVVERGARCGLAVDGDGDRCVLVDERGEPVHGDVLGWWLASQLAVDGVAATVMSTHALESALSPASVSRTPVGDRFLQAAMAAEGLALGFEESGHVLFADGLPTGCGILTGLRAVAPLLATDRPVSQQLGAFTPWPRATAKVRVSQRPPLEQVSSLQKAIKAAEDGLGDGRTLLRYSGTEPVLRILVEGPDAAEVKHACEHLRRTAERVLA